MDSLLKADDKKLNEYLLLSNGKFNIPYTQRPYEWSNSQVERLFNDIIAIHQGDKEQHILNFITIYLEDDHQNIYDGQQRTVTLLLFICAIIDKISKMGDVSIANKLKEEFIKKDDWRHNSANNTKIIFTKNETNEFFESYIIDNQENIDINISDHEKYLKSNYDYLKKLINEYVEKNHLSVSDLPLIIENMTEKMYVIILETPNEDIANQMFETLNNTGKKLVDFYVLKNECVKKISESETSRYWNEIEANTDLLDKKKFLTQFISIYNGKTSNQKVYETIEKLGKLKNSQAVRELLEDMKSVSKYFFELHEPEQRKNTNDSREDLSDYIKLVESLKVFNAIQYRPVILAMNLKRYSLKDINQVLQVCLTIQIRNIFIAHDSPNKLENFYPDLAKKIYESHKNITSSIISELQNKIISDNQTIQYAKQLRISKSDGKKIRYILKTIYDLAFGNEMIVNSNTQYVNLEHILPQNPKEDSTWLKTFDKKTLDDYINSLGNLTLILGKKNSSLGNKEFYEKRVLLKESKISQNHEIADNDSWGKKEIEDRTEYLANKIIQIWKKN
ncbi:DUF262 domain-containing protein [Staphylococcus simulans]|uniref:DUF262 domain-containing protein n=9 Tax=Staphylococcus simulans TaxID=1286 RepID=UPI000D043937|nr:DUF1524 domain-containing protein [Staphylococcus simulans]PTJ08198.1 DUF262 domain-containing protein [Staphylococcus simulans]PTJ36877.1 DUF262 domain-containing protein [Staphylococcus simulans]PTJ43001.1 DUF262 domain-containing protein [Staphylococcus simulans]RIN57509.1 DUF262 domain-containing protein [Staphylococcus simulans]RIN62240.1 DUF262 domain-containing protein [Staphylococcus simulans]